MATSLQSLKSQEQSLINQVNKAKGTKAESGLRAKLHNVRVQIKNAGGSAPKATPNTVSVGGIEKDPTKVGDLIDIIRDENKSVADQNFNNSNPANFNTDFGSQQIIRDPATGQVTVNQSLNPQIKEQFDKQTNYATNLLNNASNLSNQVSAIDISGAPQLYKADYDKLGKIPELKGLDALNKPKLDYSGLGAIPELDMSKIRPIPTLDLSMLQKNPLSVSEAAFSQDREKIENAVYDKYKRTRDKQFEQDEAVLKQSLVDRGIPIGSEAWNQAYNQLRGSYQEGDLNARDQSILTGSAEQSNMIANLLKQRADYGNTQKDIYGSELDGYNASVDQAIKKYQSDSTKYLQGKQNTMDVYNAGWDATNFDANNIKDKYAADMQGYNLGVGLEDQKVKDSVLAHNTYIDDQVKKQQSINNGLSSIMGTYPGMPTPQYPGFQGTQIDPANVAGVGTTAQQINADKSMQEQKMGWQSKENALDRANDMAMTKIGAAGGGGGGGMSIQDQISLYDQKNQSDLNKWIAMQGYAAQNQPKAPPLWQTLATSGLASIAQGIGNGIGSSIGGGGNGKGKGGIKLF